MICQMQVASQIIALALLFLTSSEEKQLDRFTILSISTGFLSSILGEIGKIYIMCKV
jgi:hypothetical protein